MALATAIAVAGLAISGYGTVSSAQSSKKASKASRQQEAVRKEQLQLDSARQRRVASRNAAVARANAIASSTASGAFGSSREAGVQASLTSQEAEQISTINQAEDLGFSIFNLNQQIAEARSDASVSQSIAGFGLDLAKNREQITRVGNELFGSTSSVGVSDLDSAVNELNSIPF